MALVMKYRLGEVAKDFGVPNKDIAAIMAEYFAPSKNHMQVLANEELDVIFEYMTQHNQVASLEEIFQVPALAAPAAEPEKEKADKAEALKMAKEADVIIAAVGENVMPSRKLRPSPGRMAKSLRAHRVRSRHPLLRCRISRRSSPSPTSPSRRVRWRRSVLWIRAAVLP